MIEAVRQALDACAVPEHRQSVVLVPAWHNGFFPDDPLQWAAIAHAIGATMDEVMDARYRAFFAPN